MAVLVKTLGGLAYASVKTRNGLAVASIKAINGVDVTSSAYLLSENFEAPGYENSWTEAGSGTKTPNYNTAPAPLEGSYSLRLLASAQTPNTTSPTFATTADVWGYFLFNVAALPSANRKIFGFRNSTTLLGSLEVTSAGLLRALAVGGTAALTVSAISAATTYHIWIHYVKGSGADALMTVGFSTSGTKPTSGNAFASSSNGTVTSDCDNIQLGLTSNGTYDALFDKVRVSASAIGDNPS